MSMLLYKFTRIILSLAVIFQLSGGEKVGICDICMESNSVACLDEYRFSTCYNGLPTATITPCPGGRVCTADRQICRLPADGFTPVCYEESCGNCRESNGVFTCLDQTTYGYCFGRSTPYSEAIRTCPQGYVCNIHSSEVCVPAETNKPSCLAINTTPSPVETETDSTTASPTIPTPTPPLNSSTEAPPPPQDANAYCKTLGKPGNFKTEDPTCRQYLYCYPLSGQYLGWFFYCDGYFNGETMKCQTERPPDCEEQ